MPTEYTQGYDEVVILYNGQRMFPDVEIMRFNTNVDATMFTQPLEDGTEASDHRVVNLSQVSFSAIMPTWAYRTVFQEMRRHFQLGTIFQVFTKVETYPSMTLQALPYQVDGESPDKIEVVMQFMEYRKFQARFVTYTIERVENPKNSSTVNRGRTQGEEVTGNDQSILARGADRLGRINRG